MINLKKTFILALFLIIIILVAGCRGKSEAERSLEDIRSGTEGVAVSFLPNNPPETIHVLKAGDTDIGVVLELKNKGAYPQPDNTDETGNFKVGVYLSGYDRSIIENLNINADDIKSERIQQTLFGKSTVNPSGGTHFVTFEGKIKSDNLNIEKYEPALLATVCYNYQTIAGPVVCIDPDPYLTVQQKKVCEVQDINLNNQGAPIAVTRIDEEAFEGKTEFKITVRNVGNGDLLKQDVITSNKCNPVGTDKIKRDDIDRVKLESVRIGNTDLTCGPFAEGANVKEKSGIIRLVDREGFIICELSKQENDAYKSSQNSYTTPLKIRLTYGYRTTAERKIEIKKELSSSGSQ